MSENIEYPITAEARAKLIAWGETGDMSTHRAVESRLAEWAQDAGCQQDAETHAEVERLLLELENAESTAAPNPIRRTAAESEHAMVAKPIVFIGGATWTSKPRDPAHDPARRDRNWQPTKVRGPFHAAPGDGRPSDGRRN